MTSEDYICKSEDVAAYLDGELDPAALSLFEQHIKGCPCCAAGLRDQRRLLCTLDFALNDDPGLSLPQNFAQIVAAHAESDMRGVRERSEHGRAFRLCVALAALSFALLGGTAIGESVLLPVGVMAKRVASVFDVIAHTVYDAGVGLTVILRAISRRFIFESHPLSALALLFLAAALALLPRLIAGYHRARIIE